MRIGVIGAGPVGGILAAGLARAGNEVCLVDVDARILSAAKGEGLRIAGPAAEKIAGPFTVRPADAVSDISKAGTLDVVFVCVKTTVQEAVAATLKKVWSPGTILVSFQNGIDPEEVLAEVAGRDNTLRAVIYYAGHVVKPGTYEVNFFNPPNFVGALTEKGLRPSKAIAELLSEARLTTAAVDDIKKRAYEKTALNATLCPICVLTGLTMGEAMAVPDIRKLVREILGEAWAIAGKMGWTFERTMDDWMRQLEAGGAHRTSMAEDMSAGRKTEISFMNGKICEYGEKLGVPTPYNNAMTWAILGKERSAGR